MTAVSGTVSGRKLIRGAAMIAVLGPIALLAACAQPAPPPPQPVVVQPAYVPPPAPMSVPPARG